MKGQIRYQQILALLLATIAVGGKPSNRTEEIGPAATVRFTSVVAGGDHTCALSEQGQAYCWGEDDRGQLGRGGGLETCEPEFKLKNLPLPKRACSTRGGLVSGSLRFVSLSAGRDHTCGITVDSLAYCWGSNWRGALGVSNLTTLCSDDPRDVCSRVPVPVEGRRRFITISAGIDQTCALTPEGALSCWGQVNGGFSRSEALWANGSCPGDQPPPNLTAEEKRFMENMEPYDSLRRAQGLSRVYPCTSVPTLVHADVPLVAVAVPYMLDRAGALYVLWGHAVRLSTLTADSSPRVTLSTLAQGEMGGCAVARDGHIHCWRLDDDPQKPEPPKLAPTSAESHATEPAEQFLAVDESLLGACALSTTGVIYCTGGENDVFGIASTDKCFEVDAYVPCNKTWQRLQAPTPPFTALTAGWQHLCALTAEGQAYCWGENTAGQLGTGDTVTHKLPTPIVAPDT